MRGVLFGDEKFLRGGGCKDSDFENPILGGILVISYQRGRPVGQWGIVWGSTHRYGRFETTWARFGVTGRAVDPSTRGRT